MSATSDVTSDGQATQATESTRKFIDPHDPAVIEELSLILFRGMRSDFAKLPEGRRVNLDNWAVLTLRKLQRVSRSPSVGSLEDPK